MCGRFSLFRDVALVEEAFDVQFPEETPPRYNIAPRDDIAVVPGEADHDVDFKQWGLLAPWADDPEDGPRPINARAETVHEKPMFEEPFERRRCLILADGFYEWKGDRGAKQPYRIQLEDARPFAMAGIWERWERDGDSLDTAAIVTTDANDVLEPIHDRMPVVLERGTERDWLHAGVDAAREALDPYDGDDMEAVRISTRVNNPANDSPAVLEPSDAGEQRGLGEFGD